MKVERAIRLRLKACPRDSPAGETLVEIERKLADVAESVKSLDSHHVACKWLDDFAARREMFLSLRRDETVQVQIRRMLFGDGI